MISLEKKPDKIMPMNNWFLRRKESTPNYSNLWTEITTWKKNWTKNYILNFVDGIYKVCVENKKGQ